MTANWVISDADGNVEDRFKTVLEAMESLRLGGYSPNAKVEFSLDPNPCGD